MKRKSTKVRKFRYANAGEVTVFQKQCAMQSGLPAAANNRLMLVWVAESDVIGMGEEFKQQGAKA